jgi:hypothetical protein
VSQLPLDEFHQEDPTQLQNQARRRRAIVLALIAIVAGVALGYLAALIWLVPSVPQTIELSRSEQDDYIIMVAEAYAIERNVPLAQQRLARLNDPRTTERIIALAQEYAPQQDYVALRLALLAVAAGSKDKTLVALAATLVAPTHTPTFTPTSTRTPTPTRTVPTNTPPPTNTLAPNYVVITNTPTNTPPPTWTPTPIIETEDERPAVIVPIPVNFVAQKIVVTVPGYANTGSAEIRLTARPKTCTPADQMPQVITRTTLLCAGQTYAPFAIEGNNLTLYGDANRTALVKGEARQYAITVHGSNIVIDGVHVEGATHDHDLNQWLCLYPFCPYTPEIGGAQGYGGGILLKNTSNAAVVNSQFNGGTTGVFVYRGYSNKIFHNSFGDHNGWGIMLMQTRSDYIVGNKFARINRGCDGLDKVYHANGCESSALAMTHVDNILVYDNSCRRVSNCYYANGDGGYGSSNLKFYNNFCAGAKNNCFEATFGLGHEFDYNTAVFDADFGDHCDYPFWIGGSTAYFGTHNDWKCLHDFDTAVNDSRSKSDQPTEARALAERPTPTPTLTPTRQSQIARPGTKPTVQPAVSQ